MFLRPVIFQKTYICNSAILCSTVFIVAAGHLQMVSVNVKEQSVEFHVVRTLVAVLHVYRISVFTKSGI